MFFSDEITICLNCVKGLVWNLTRKRKAVPTVRHPIKAMLGIAFQVKASVTLSVSKQNPNAELMCNISKRDLLPTARKQFGHDSTGSKLQEDNDDPKHTSKLAVNWKRNNGVYEIHWPSMSPVLATVENIRQPLMMNLRKKIESYQSVVSTIKREWEFLPLELTFKLVHSINNRISEVAESHSDFILL